MCRFQMSRRQPACTCLALLLFKNISRLWRALFCSRCLFLRMAAKVESHGSGITIYVTLSCVVAAISGLMFGYAIGISGGVTSMDSFLMYFFPLVYEKKQVAVESNYCKFSDPLLQAFTSSMYVAGLFTSFVASYTTQKLGRQPTMLIAGCLHTMGAALLTFAQNVAMLFIGRIVIGCSVGFGNQAAPIYLSEMAPAKLRGSLNIIFQLLITGGILVAELVNFGTDQLSSWGWRVSFGLGIVPSILSILGVLMLCETPNSLIERGHLDEGKAVLMKIRGTTDVDDEYQDLMKASLLARVVKHPFRNMLRRQNIPPLVMAIMFQVFQQLGGINAIMFYSPVLFQTVGFGSNAALYSTVLTGAMNFGSTILSITLVDRFSRRFILLSSGVVLFFTQRQSQIQAPNEEKRAISKRVSNLDGEGIFDRGVDDADGMRHDATAFAVAKDVDEGAHRPLDGGCCDRCHQCQRRPHYLAAQWVAGHTTLNATKIDAPHNDELFSTRSQLHSCTSRR